MEVKTIDSRMRALTKKYRELDRENTSKIWNELIHVIDQYLSGCQADAFETFYALFIKNVDIAKSKNLSFNLSISLELIIVS